LALAAHRGLDTLDYQSLIDAIEAASESHKDFDLSDF
jgi:hypothetical protein